MHLRKKALTTSTVVAFALVATPAAALDIIADYSALGTVYQDGSGFLSNSPSSGSVDVTSHFISNFETAIGYWENAISIPGWTNTFTVQLNDLSVYDAVGDNATQSYDANGRPNSNIMNVDSGNIGFFVDPTPTDNSEFIMQDYTTAAGGPTVNVGRYGTAALGSAC